MQKKSFEKWILILLLTALYGCESNSPGDRRESKTTVMSCTEIMYHDKTDLEFVELKIESGPAIENMAEVMLRLDGAVSYTFPSEPLDTGEYIVVTNDISLFNARYPDFSGRLFGPWDIDPSKGTVGRLSNEGDVVEVKLTGKGDVDCRFDGAPPWPSLADGKGHSLVYIGGSPAHPSSWAASKKDGGNPGGPDEHIAPLTVRINEVKPYINGPGWIEFYNSGTSDVDIGGWKIVQKLSSGDISDSIPSPAVVPAKGYLVKGNSVSSDTGFFQYFSKSGVSLYLREVVDGKETKAESGLEYPATPQTSAGVIELSDGSLEQGSLLEETPGKKNSGPLMGPLYFQEIHYHPVDNSGTIEFIEIVNLSDTIVPLYNLEEKEAWKVKGIGLTFGSQASVPAKGMMILIQDTLMMDTADFRSKYKIDSGIPIVTYPGKISNRGELLVLQKPVSCHLGTNPENPLEQNCDYEWSDAVLYSDRGAWPTEADGNGKSLNRLNFTISGHEPGNWKAETPTPGK